MNSILSLFSIFKIKTENLRNMNKTFSGTLVPRVITESSENLNDSLATSEADPNYPLTPTPASFPWETTFKYIPFSGHWLLITEFASLLYSNPKPFFSENLNKDYSNKTWMALNRPNWVVDISSLLFQFLNV